MFRSPAGRVSVMQVLVLAAIVLVLLAFGFPIYRLLQQNKHKADAGARLQKLSTAMRTYVSQHDNMLPDEDAAGKDTWDAAKDPKSDKTWYNALPKILGQRSVGEYASAAEDFYKPDNVLFVPGAVYPENKMAAPLFAIAFNTKLHRKDAEGRDTPLRISDITTPARTVLLLEQGLPKEDRAMAQQSKKDYDGASKGSAKSFVARYRGKGWLLFVDGHADLYEAKDLLTETGRFPFPVSGMDVIWGRTPEEDPNKP
jgi:hypothetical protein